VDGFVIRDMSGLGSIEFLGRELIDPQRGVERVTIRLSAPGLSAEGAADMAWFPDQLLAELARDWAGWDGVREWQSLEYELVLGCTHDRVRGHVRVVAALGARLAGWEFTWQARVAVVIPGGDLERLAREAAAFFAPGGAEPSAAADRGGR
jgi:hypothetical protein